MKKLPSMRVFIASLLFGVSLQTLPAQPGAKVSLPFNPQAGETVVFLGDSITHQSLYNQYLESFFITRYPDRRIKFVNAGVGGDSAGDALARFADDVAVHEPDYVTVLLGMNDGRYEEFDAGIFKAYREGVSELIDKIEAIGAKPVLLSPTMFDHEVAEDRAEDDSWRFGHKEFPENYNALMAFYGAWLQEEAGRRGVAFVGLWGPLNRHTVEQRRTDPEFTLIGDAIHPQASGHVVMAFEVLSQLGVERRGANSIVIAKRGDRWRGTKEVKKLKANEDGSELRFLHTPVSLPWVIPEKHAAEKLRWQLPSDGRVGYAITKAGHKLSADRLKITGLAPGQYEVSIGGNVVGSWSHIALGTKVELQANEKTPQFQQALEVALLNRRRNDEFMRPARDLCGRTKGLRKREGNAAKITEAIESVNALKENAAVMLDEVYEAAQPVEVEWVVRRVGEAPGGKGKKMRDTIEGGLL